MSIRLRGDRPLQGRVRPTSDKSLSHRALMLAGVADGTSRIRDLNPGADVASTRECLEALGVRISGEAAELEVTGRAGELRCPTGTLPCGNSGTTMRLMAGILASQDFTATLDGDESLRRRPMRRIAVPLRGLGARVEGPDNGEHAPLVVTGPVRRGGGFSSPVASAQVKSAVLLAAALGGVRVRIEEPGPSRDHTERMLNAFGVECRWGEGFALVDPDPGQKLRACDLRIPGDPSAAALLAACALAVPGSEVEFDEVLLNPRRIGAFRVLERMGAQVDLEPSGEEAGEPVGRVRVRSADLAGTVVRAGEIPSLVDEVPALAALAAVATGTTRFEGVGELRLKESDRLQSMVELLGAFGVAAEAGPDWMEVTGSAPVRPDRIAATGDHRILMATAVLGLAARARGADAWEIDPAGAAISDPAFFGQLRELHGVE